MGLRSAALRAAKKLRSYSNIIFLLNRVPVRRIVLLVAIKKSVFPTMKMTPHDASVMMVIQENLAVSEDSEY